MRSCFPRAFAGPGCPGVAFAFQCAAFFLRWCGRSISSKAADAVAENTNAVTSCDGRYPK